AVVVRVRVDELDAAGLELRAQREELLLVEVVLGHEGLQRMLVDDAELLGVLEKRPCIHLQQIAQFSHSLCSCSPPQSFQCELRRLTSPDRRSSQRKTTRGNSTFRPENVKILQIRGISYTMRSSRARGTVTRTIRAWPAGT